MRIPKLKINADPVIPMEMQSLKHDEIHTREMKSVSKSYLHPVFTAALVTTAKTRKQPNAHQRING